MSGQDTDAVWRRSSRCGPNWHCVELTRAGGRIILRDSKNPGQVLELRGATWTTFVSGIQQGT